MEKIITFYVRPLSWQAISEDNSEGDIIGFGATEPDAIADFKLKKKNKSQEQTEICQDDLLAICLQIYQGLRDKKNRNIAEEAWHLSLDQALKNIFISKAKEVIKQATL